MKVLIYPCCWVCLFVLIFTSPPECLAHSGELRSGEPFTADPEQPKYVPDEILVAFNPGTPESTIYEIHRRCGATSAYPGFSGRFYNVRFGEGKPVGGAWVFGSWSGPVGWPDFSFTDMDGIATFYSGPIFGAGEVDFTVQSVSKAGWRYKSGTTIPDVPENGSTSVTAQGKFPIAWGKLKGKNGETLPSSTEFYQNYPNPFNPDTWIPYQLAEDAEVVINIYNAAGRLVRTLDLGFKREGFYLEKDVAARWDGRDENGERVSSGIYFYVVRAGDFTAARKMTVIE